MPVNENVTKSVMSGNEFKGSEFMVWSWFNPAPATSSIKTFQDGLADGETTRYVDEKPFIEKSNGKWGGQVAYFWPKTGSLVFAGYHAPKLENADDVKYTFSETENYMTFNDVSQVEVASGETWTEDIMYFNMTPNSYNTTSGIVNLSFRHALTWMSVTLEKKVKPEIAATIKIHEVYFTDVCTKGDGKVDGQSIIDWTEDTATKKDHYLLQNTDGVELKYSGTGSEIQSVVVNLSDYLIIPQKIYGQLKVRYSVISDDADLSSFTETYTVDLTSLKDGSHNEWLPGKHYTYKISIGTDELLVTPKVDNWEEQPTSILIPLPEVTPGQPGTDDDNE